MNDIVDIKEFRKRMGCSRKEFADKLFVSIHTVDAWEKGKRNPPKTKLMLINSIFGDNVPNNTTNEAVEISINYLKVPVVPIRAQAGFLNGYGDDTFWDGLPTELWEVDKEYKGRYVVFEVKGDSMDNGSVDAILENDRILCREIGQQHWKNKLHFNKFNFVIVHRQEGVIVKRIIEHEVEKGIIKCHSLNPYYEDFELNLNDVAALYNVVDLKRNLRL